FTCTVNVAVPAAVGVPEMVPSAASVSPAGSAPTVTVHALPPAPPVAARICWYAVPTVPPGRLAVETVSAAGAIAMLRDFVAVAFAASFTCTVNVAVPDAVGLPEMVPSVARESPAGNAPVVIVQTLLPLPPLAASTC